MRKHPLVTLSACGFLSIGGIAALLDTGSTHGVLSSQSQLNDARNALHQTDLRDHLAQTYQLDGYFIERRADLDRLAVDRRVSADHAVTGTTSYKEDMLIRAAALYRLDLARKAAQARHEAVLRRERAAAAAKAAAQAAAEAAAAAAAQAAAAATTTTVAPPPVAPKPKPVPKPKPKPVPKPPVHKPVPVPAPVPAGGVWYELRMCESHDDYSINTGNGYYGAYQFSLSTWYGLGYTGLPSDAPPAVQDAAAQKLQAMYGWGQWPGCSAALGL